MTSPENFDDGVTQVAPPGEFNPSDHPFDLCKDGCFCMTYTIKGKCGKCGASKSQRCICDCHLFVGGSGKACPKCIKKDCSQESQKTQGGESNEN